jgi:predicted RNase H-like HicB family nuclease
VKVADKMKHSFEAVVQKEAEDEGYFGYIPMLPGCFSNGKTPEETMRNLREAIQTHVSSLLSHGKSIPQ